MNSNINVNEIGKIVRDMTKDVTQQPNYNAVAASIVKQGIVDKNNARYGITSQPEAKKTLS